MFSILKSTLIISFKKMNLSAYTLHTINVLFLHAVHTHIYTNSAVTEIRVSSYQLIKSSLLFQIA